MSEAQETARFRELLATPAIYVAVRDALMRNAEDWLKALAFDLLLMDTVAHGTCKSDPLNCPRCAVRAAFREAIGPDALL